MPTRRSFLASLAALPFVGWMFPQQETVGDVIAVNVDAFLGDISDRVRVYYRAMSPDGQECIRWRQSNDGGHTWSEAKTVTT